MATITRFNARVTLPTRTYRDAEVKTRGGSLCARTGNRGRKRGGCERQKSPSLKRFLCAVRARRKSRAASDPQRAGWEGGQMTNDSPQPHVDFTLGFWIWKPAFWRLSE
jgi:hypothetical protein